MATERWISSVPWTPANISATRFNALANGNALLSDLSISNDTALDIFADLAWLAGGTSITAVTNPIVFYLYPLGQDGVTYGDGRFTSSGVGPPPDAYQVGEINFPISVSAATIVGVSRGIILPPAPFSFLVYNQSGAPLPNGNTFRYRTYNRQIS